MSLHIVRDIDDRMEAAYYTSCHMGGGYMEQSKASYNLPDAHMSMRTFQRMAHMPHDSVTCIGSGHSGPIRY